jgi:N-acetylglucosaminyldiphosphoundecaprenol N-acetyl-beta-D-mannosaminyltransferase
MKISVLGVKVDKTAKQEVVRKVGALLKSKKKFYIVTPNPEIVLAAHRSSKLARILNSADFSIPDGVGLKLADSSLEIIKGRELMVDLLALANEYRLRVYLLGGAPRANDGAKTFVEKNYPNIILKADYGMKLNTAGEPVSAMDEQKEQKILRAINVFSPDLLFVAFGAPKQEFWVFRWLSKIKIGGVMVVGGSLDYIAGRHKVPRVITRLGLEWLWRVIREPKRVGRIINAVVVFPLVLLVEKIKKGNR